MWFILESLAPMPIEALQEASDKLVAGFRAMSPQARIEARLIKP
jgi:DNA/RNA-binding domain of Phe-tRNA-synthetase-like protein